MQSAVLYKCSENEDEADGDEQVHGGYVGNFREGLPGDGAQRGHGEHGGDAWSIQWKDTNIWLPTHVLLRNCD